MKHKLIQRSTRLAAIGLALLLAAGTLPTPAGAQAQGSITPNYKDADLSQIIEAVSAVTGKNFIVDPRVKAQVTMLSSTPMTPNAFYEAFLSILQVHGFVAVQSGDVVKIVPDANARQLPANDLPSRISSTKSSPQGKRPADFSRYSYASRSPVSAPPRRGRMWRAYQR